MQRVKAILCKLFPRMSQSYMTDLRRIGLGVLTKKRYVAKAGEVCVPMSELGDDCVNLRID